MRAFIYTRSSEPENVAVVGHPGTCVAATVGTRAINTSETKDVLAVLSSDVVAFMKSIVLESYFLPGASQRPSIFYVTRLGCGLKG